MKYPVLLIAVFAMACASGSETVQEEPVEVKNLLGTWTDGDGPNSTIRIKQDSIYNVDLSEWLTYELKDDSIIINEDGEIVRAQLSQPHVDTLVVTMGPLDVTRYWRTEDFDADTLDVAPDTVEID